MKKKRVICFLLSTLVLSTSVGCGQTSSTQTGEAVDGTEVAESTGAQTTAEIPSGTVSLTVWGAEEDQELLAEIVEGFKAEYAGKADFEITISPESESTSKETLLGDVENGADVFAFVDDQMMALVAAGALIPVENADKVAETSNAGAVAAATVNDTLYAYPMTADNGYFMYYNKEYFTESDVATLDGMLAVAEAAEKKIVMDWGSGWYLYSFFGNTGLTVGLSDDGITNYCTWNSTEGDIKGTDVAQAMLNISASPGFQSMGSSEFLAGVQDGSVIAGVSGVWDATTIEAAWGKNYGAVKLPTYTCAGKQVQMASFAGYKMVGANAYSDQPYWSMKLAEWITNEENQNLRFEKRSQGPANLNAASSSAVQESPAIKAILAQSEFASLQRIGGKYWNPVMNFGNTMAAGNPDGSALQDLLDKMVEQITALN